MQLHNAFGIDQGIDLTTFNALGDAMQSPNGVGLGILKVRVAAPCDTSLACPQQCTYMFWFKKIRSGQPHYSDQHFALACLLAALHVLTTNLPCTDRCEDPEHCYTWGNCFE